jgi:uncharacterized membrane protein
MIPPLHQGGLHMSNLTGPGHAFATHAHTRPLRSFIKAVSWRILGSIDTFVISYLVTGQAKWGVAIASVEALTKIFLYYFHERVWGHVRWGLAKEVTVSST